MWKMMNTVDMTCEQDSRLRGGTTVTHYDTKKEEGDIFMRYGYYPDKHFLN